MLGKSVAASSTVERVVREMRKRVGGRAVVWNEDPFRVLISTVLSQRTRDENTRLASKRLFSRYGTPSAIADAPVRELEELIRPSGFYRVKAGRIKRISHQILEEFGGKVPRKREDMMRLEGVGAKTAGCVQVYGFDDDGLPVDTHVHRISNRLGLVSTKSPEKTEPLLKELVPRKHWKEINLLMVRYGQSVCLPRNPRCGTCGLRDVCEYYKKSGMQEKEASP
jgi:endonuclease-3